MSTAITPAKLRKNRREWIAALRSGKYEQGRGRLCREGKYCCLGVACEVLYGPSPDGTWFGVGGPAPSTLIRDLGLDGRWGLLSGKTAFGLTLAGANDSGKTFTEIADFIEAHPWFVFPDLEEGDTL